MALSRRGFLDRAWKLIAAVLVGEGAWTTWDFLRPRTAKGFGATINVGAPEGFPEDAVRYFSNGRMYLVRVEGELLALFQKCPHLGCRVPYCETSARFECPCHGSVFNRKGEYITGPAPRGMDSFPLAIEEGAVLVDTGTVVEGPPKSRRTLDEGEVGPSCLGQVEEQFGRTTPGHDDNDDHGDNDDMGDDGDMEHGE